MEDKARAAVMGGFVADALSLGAHWIYDTDRIDREIGRVEQLLAPPVNSFHPTKGKGDFTHYGDQMLVLLESVAASGGFESTHFMDAWKGFFSDYKGYFDHATKSTLSNIGKGASPGSTGSESSDLSGASRIAALVYRYRNDETGFATAARAQTAMTHNHPHVVDAAEFFARVTVLVLEGQAPMAAVQTVQSRLFDRDPFAGWVRDGLGSVEQDTRETLKRFGQMCDVNAGFPGVMHLIGKYENRFREGLVENVMAGGDSAARGILFGMIIGAHMGFSSIPENWVSELNVSDRIRSLTGA